MIDTTAGFCLYVQYIIGGMFKLNVTYPGAIFCFYITSRSHVLSYLCHNLVLFSTALSLAAQKCPTYLSTIAFCTDQRNGQHITSEPHRVASVGLFSLISNHHEYNAHRKFYDRLFTFGTTLSKLRDATLAERLYLGSTDTISVAGRSLAWKVFIFLWIQGTFS